MDLSSGEWYLQNTKDGVPLQILLNQSELMVGRVSHNMPNYVSRSHALFKFDGTNWSVIDLKSVNGLYCNHKKLKPSEANTLSIGAKIAFSSLESQHVYELIGPIKQAAVVKEEVVINSSPELTTISSPQNPASPSIENNAPELVTNAPVKTGGPDVTENSVANVDTATLFRRLEKKLTDIEKYLYTDQQGPVNEVITVSSSDSESELVDEDLQLNNGVDIDVERRLVSSASANCKAGPAKKKSSLPMSPSAIKAEVNKSDEDTVNKDKGSKRPEPAKDINTPVEKRKLQSLSPKSVLSHFIAQDGPLEKLNKASVSLDQNKFKYDKLNLSSKSSASNSGKISSGKEDILKTVKIKVEKLSQKDVSSALQNGTESNKLISECHSTTERKKSLSKFQEDAIEVMPKMKHKKVVREKSTSSDSDSSVDSLPRIPSRTRIYSSSKPVIQDSSSDSNIEHQKLSKEVVECHSTTPKKKKHKKKKRLKAVSSGEDPGKSDSDSLEKHRNNNSDKLDDNNVTIDDLNEEIRDIIPACNDEASACSNNKIRVKKESHEEEQIEPQSDNDSDGEDTPNEEDFFPELSQAFFDSEQADLPDLEETDSRGSNDASSEMQPWLSTKQPDKKRIQVINALPMPGRKRKSESDKKPPCHKEVTSRFIKDSAIKNKMPVQQKKKKGPTLQSKIRHSYDYRIRAAGGGSDNRRKSVDSSDIRITAHIPKLAKRKDEQQETVKTPDTPDSHAPPPFKIPKRSSNTRTVKRLPDSSSSRSEFLTKEIELKPKKKVNENLKLKVPPKPNCDRPVVSVASSAHVVTPPFTLPFANSAMCPPNIKSPSTPSPDLRFHSTANPLSKRRNSRDNFQPADSTSNWQTIDFIQKIVAADANSLKDDNDQCYGLDVRIGAKISYDSADDYIQTYSPLLALEIVSGAAQSLRTPNNLSFSIIINSYEAKQNKSCHIYCEGVVSKEKSKCKYFRQTGILVLMSLPLHKAPHEGGAKFIQVLGVTNLRNYMRKQPVQKNEADLHKGYSKNNENVRVSMEVITKPNIPSIDQSKPAQIEFLDYIRPAIRKFQALLDLPKYSIYQDLLVPQMNHFQTEIYNHNLLRTDLNATQVTAVLKSIGAIKTNPSEPKIVLVQGPPGTGKSYTIVRLIEELLNSSQNKRNRPHILLLTQTNCAIDQLIRKLNELRKQYKREGIDRKLNFVRIGDPELTHEDVKEYLLENLIRTNMNMLNKKQNQEKGDGNDQAHNNANKSRMLKEQIIGKADVIATTLNSCSHPALQSLNLDSPFFSALIIDEACQCTELELLLPLQYRINKIILVGDPRQLPATVMSRRAYELNYGRSFFQRSCEYFKAKYNMLPLHVLSVQYRMHPDICAFPSHKFYQNQLVNDTATANKRSESKIKPYLVLDINKSAESIHNGHISNISEALVVVNICTVLLGLVTADKSIAVITPYRQQQQDITGLLDKKNITNIEVNTVDGFQGREVDIVIFSCVRSQNYCNSIGFLSDIRRLNVAITRAKESLIICANLHSLEVNPTWKSLIDNAKSRQLQITVDESITPQLFMK